MGAIADKKRERPESGVRAKALRIGEHPRVSHGDQRGDGAELAKGNGSCKALPDTVWADEGLLGRRLSIVWRRAIDATATQAVIATAAGVSKKTVSHWCDPKHPRSLPNSRHVALIMKHRPRTYRAWRRLNEGLSRGITPAPSMEHGAARLAAKSCEVVSLLLSRDENQAKALLELRDEIARVEALERQTAAR